MRVETAIERARASRGISRRGLLAILAVAALGIAVTLVSSRAMIAAVLRSFVWTRASGLGFGAGHGYLEHSWTGHLSSDVPHAVRNWASSLLASPDVPRIHIDVKFRHLTRLRQQRAQAIAEGILTQGEDDYVPARLRLADRTVRADLRLKGDLVVGQFSSDDSWSFRVHVKDEDHVLGLRRFNLHEPFARDYHAEPLFLQHVRHVGVLAPRYAFVRVALNGDDLGLMAVEEHFSKELLESQQRRDGVILKLDESRRFTFLDREQRRSNAFNNFLVAELLPFRSTRVAANPALASDLRAAVGLYRAFCEGSLAPSEVFDAKLMGRFLAVAEAWSAWHAASWRNVRFYYNPITALLEPIAYDAELVMVGYQTPEPLHAMLLADAAVRSEYEATLRGIAEREPWAFPADALAERQQEHLAVLHRFWPFLKPFDLSEIPLAAEEGLRRDPVERVRVDPLSADPWPTYELEASDYRPRDLALVNLVEDGGGTVLELRNLVPFPVRVAGSETPGAAGAGPTAFPPPTILAPTELGALPATVRIPVADGDHVERVFVSAVGIPGGEWVEPTPYFPPARSIPVPEPSLDALSANRFLEYDPLTRTVSCGPGAWEVSGSVSLPSGVALVLEPGTELSFEPSAILVVRGPSVLHGTPAEPVVLKGRKDGAASGWRGAVFFNDGREADWSSVRVRGTTGVELPGWHLTAGVTVYQGDVSIVASEFTGNLAEDALNLIRTSFSLVDVSVRDAVSDGIDVDFGRGTVSGGVIAGIGSIGGGDGLDFSGADARVSGVRFADVGDKALSIGERSRVRAREITVERAGVAAVSKDGSYLSVDGLVARGLQHAALMAYEKKREFGGAALDATRVTAIGRAPKALAQVGSVLSLDGERADTVELDVDLLYATIMRRGPRP